MLAGKTAINSAISPQAAARRIRFLCATRNRARNCGSRRVLGLHPDLNLLAKRSLTSLQQRLVKTGGRLVKHARYYWLLLAEGHLNRRRFGAMLGRIAVLPLRTG